MNVRCVDCAMVMSAHEMVVHDCPTPGEARLLGELEEGSPTCPGCGSRGFGPSTLGPDRCTFCDGTEGGNLLTDKE